MLSGSHKRRCGIVSADTPLISNLNVWINIALIKQYHENLSRDAAYQVAMACLHRFRLEQIAHKRNPALTPQQRFCVMLLRAVMLPQAFVIIDRPFKLMPELRDGRFIYESLLKIADLYDRSCIFDYTWFEDRYRISDGT